jgi:hypothetical protein
MVNAGNAGNAGRLRVIEATAPSFGVRLSSSAIHDASEVETAIDAVARESNVGLIVMPAAPIGSAGKKPAHRVRLPTGGAHDGGNCSAVRSAQECKHPRLFRIRSRLVMAGDPAVGRLRADFRGRPRL